MAYVSFRSNLLSTAMEVTPTIFISRNRIVKKNLEKEYIATEELEQALHKHDMTTSENVVLGVQAVDGYMSELRKVNLVSVACRIIIFDLS